MLNLGCKRIPLHCSPQSSLPLVTLLSLLPPTPHLLQATTARCAYGCWTTGRACRRSLPTGRSMMRPFMTWPSTLPSPSLPAPAQMHLPKSLSDITVVVLVRWRVPRKEAVWGEQGAGFLGVFLWGAINSEKQMAMSSCYLLTRKHPFIYCWIFKIPLNTKLCFCCPLFLLVFRVVLKSCFLSLPFYF